MLNPTAQELRRQAQNLLDQAQALDDLHPRVVIYETRHSGTNVYLFWSTTELDPDDAISKVAPDFDEDSENITIINEAGICEELAGVLPA